MRKFSKVIAVVLSILILCTGFSAFAENNKKVYVVLGDSIAAGTGLANPSETSYAALVCAADGFEYRNHAVSGYTTSSVLSQLYYDDTVYDDVERADIISISIGGNNFLGSGFLDLVYTAGLKGDYTKFDSINEWFYDEFNELIDEILYINPDAFIVVQTLYNPRYGAMRSTYQQAVNRVNSTIKRSLKENPGEFVLADVEPVFNGHVEWINADTIHPNRLGHYEIAKVILSTLKAAGQGSATQPENTMFYAQIFNWFKTLFASIKNMFA